MPRASRHGLIRRRAARGLGRIVAKKGTPVGDQPEERAGRSGDKRLVLGLAFGKTERGLEWRDGLGCYWLIGLLVIAVLWGWLTSTGVNEDAMNLIAAAAVAGLAVLFLVAARKARPPSSC